MPAVANHQQVIETATLPDTGETRLLTEGSAPAKKRGPEGGLVDREIITILMLYHSLHFKNGTFRACKSPSQTKRQSMLDFDSQNALVLLRHVDEGSLRFQGFVANLRVRLIH